MGEQASLPLGLQLLQALCLQAPPLRASAIPKWGASVDVIPAGANHAHVRLHLLPAAQAVIQLTEVKLGSGYVSTGQEDAEAGVTQEWVDEGELLRERTKKKSEMVEALRCVGRGHTRRSHVPSSSHKNLYAVEMSPGGDMVQRIMVK
ncbi:hypothetical protein B296_00027244 [Ensete ventricosum]|uniref:Uncharacterized protein n=1 Tax=Ensete ventricosum TaxID=4639 RepID=A0A426YT70_ENSVE|nr:hypothetical protein B296_00027244 [Ensete ventricosum]